jgi:hypothetical protein
MKTLTLKRISEIEDGMFGVLLDGKIPFAVTLERNWFNNQSNVSCIPAGSYRCVRRLYHKHGYWTFEVTGVPGRTSILIHSGNTEDDSMGCVLIGESFGALKSKVAILQSKEGFLEFMERLKGQDEFLLIIEKCCA